MDKIKNIEKKFCLVIGLAGMILPLITHYSCWSFGFISGLGLAGWMLLPDKEESRYEHSNDDESNKAD